MVQGLKWLDDVYGRDKRDGLLSCCAHQIFFSANDLETGAYISQSCGDKTVRTVSASQKKSFKYEPASTNVSYRGRPLISKDKATRLPRNQQIIITESSFPVLAKKIRYYKESGFRVRLLPPPEVPRLIIVSNPIPTFDIPKAGPKKPDEHDGQGSLFPVSPPKTPPMLGEWMEELEKEDDGEEG